MEVFFSEKNTGAGGGEDLFVSIIVVLIQYLLFYQL